MFFTDAVDPATLELLIQLQEKSYLGDFYLVGGTALALKTGHRKSVDIDLFSVFSFDVGQILEQISADFPFKLFFSAANTLKGSIHQVQVDILAHRYPLIRKPISHNGISMVSVEDIVAMKLNDISVSGQRIKDFIDIYYLLEKYSVHEMIQFYQEKYSLYSDVNVVKSLIWFEDVVMDDWPVILKDPTLNWKQVKKRLVSATEKYLRH